jgi:hypothetical protein
MFLSGDHPHLVQLLLLDLAIFIQKVQKIVALFNDLCVEGCSKEDAEDLLFNQPCKKQIAVKPFDSWPIRFDFFGLWSH